MAENKTLQDADGGCHIILPNNRVVAVESQLSRRLVDELLGNASRFIQDHTTTEYIPELCKGSKVWMLISCTRCCYKTSSYVVNDNNYSETLIPNFMNLSAWMAQIRPGSEVPRETKKARCFTCTRCIDVLPRNKTCRDRRETSITMCHISIKLACKFE